MKRIVREVFEANDGTVFVTQAACEAHDRAEADRAAKTTYWRVTHSPDLTEGRGYYACDYLEVYGPSAHNAEGFVMDYCFARFGRKVAFVQGVAPMPNWTLGKIDAPTFQNTEPGSRVGDISHKGNRVRLRLGTRDKLPFLVTEGAGA